MKRLLLLAVVLLAAPRAAAAYPQFSLSRQITCSACHVSPAGGGIVDNMGIIASEDDSTWGGDGRFLQRDLPEWLRAGGDFRSATGIIDAGGGVGPALFPMQVEGYAAYTKGAITAYATLGLTKPDFDNLLTLIQLREHWVMVRPDSESGWYVRAGRFQPVYGLRLSEHNLYVRRYGGTALYGETYGASAGWVSDGVEAHLTGFVTDPVRDSTEKGNGVAAYVEKRLGECAALGVQGRYAASDLEARLQGGATGKLWLPGADLLLMAEAGVTRQSFDDGPSRTQLVGQLMGSWFFRKGFLLDAGVGHYNADLSIRNQDRTSFDANLHWFLYAHMEMVLMARYELLGGGPEGSYALIQAHYRL